ncbi:MAG: hypothetical protein ACFFEE_03535, partial [Candidatus Thorarchaeota archaeon]
MYTAQPLAIEWFPFLIVIPIVLTFLGVKILKGRVPSPKDPSQFMNRVRIVVLGPYVFLYVLMMSIGLLGFLFQWDFLAAPFYFTLLLFQLAIIIGIGLIAGLLIASAFQTQGVAGYLLSATLLSLIPLALIYMGQALAAINIGLDFIDSLFIMIIIFTFCPRNFEKRLMGIEEPNESAQSTIYRRVAARYILETVRKLNLRSTHSDMVAQEVLHRFQETEGELGLFIRQVLNEGPPQRMDSEVIDRTTLTSRLSMRDKMLKPTGTWTLNEYQFNRKVRRNRILYFVFLVPLLVLLSYSLRNLSLPENQWGLIISSGIILFSFPLAYFDRLSSGRRMNAEEVIREVIGPLQVIESKKLLDDTSDE